MKFLKKITLTKILIGLLALCLAGTCLVIFKGTEQNLHSDTATAVLLAREQLRTGQWFPSSWNYGQDIWVLSLNLLVLPFLAILKDMVLSRQLAVVVQTMIIARIPVCKTDCVKRSWTVGRSRGSCPDFSFGNRVLFLSGNL